jgi:hypothetical protein
VLTKLDQQSCSQKFVTDAMLVRTSFFQKYWLKMIHNIDSDFPLAHVIGQAIWPFSRIVTEAESLQLPVNIFCKLPLTFKS